VAQEIGEGRKTSVIDFWNIGVSVVAIAITVSGWAAVYVKGIKVRAELDTNTKNDIIQLKTSVEEIKKTLGNGGFSGLRGDIQEMRVNCAESMASICSALNSHEELSGHGDMPSRMSGAEARINGLERDRKS
jgi:hypothetical protein